MPIRQRILISFGGKDNSLRLFQVIFFFSIRSHMEIDKQELASQPDLRDARNSCRACPNGDCPSLGSGSV